MDNYATKLAEAFSSKVIQRYFEEAVAEKITNQDYEGDVNEGSVVNIMTFGAIGLKNYTGSNLSPDDIYESVGELKIDQKKAYYFKVKTLDKFLSWIKNPEGTLLSETSKTLAETIDSYILSLYGDVQAGQRIGTNYTTGTVAIATDGTVTGTGTTFTSAMVGRGFKATGHTKWYRVKQVNSATELVLEQDLDDATNNAYDGGAISAGTSYVIEAVSPITLSKSTVYQYFAEARKLLNQAKMPKADRWAVVPSHISALVIQAPEYTPAVPEAYTNVVKNGLVGRLAGFDVYESESVNGDSTNGYHCLFGHRSAITMAMANLETGIEDLTGNFGKAYKGLYVYGAKVVDERRKGLVELFVK